MGELEKRETLATAALELELVAQEIEDGDGGVTPQLAERFHKATLTVAQKVDSWINYLDAGKALIHGYEERQRRLKRRLEALKNIEKGLRTYLKLQLQDHPNIPFKGTEGQLYLHKNPKSVEFQNGDPTPLRDVTVRNVIDNDLLTDHPDIRGFCKAVGYLVLDKEQLKDALERGTKLPWAHLVQDFHIRVKG